MIKRSSTTAELPFVKLNDVSLRVGDQHLFEHTNWEIRSDQHWVIVGPNGSGKSTLANAVFRRVSIVSGKIQYFFDGIESKIDSLDVHTLIGVKLSGYLLSLIAI